MDGSYAERPVTANRRLFAGFDDRSVWLACIDRYGRLATVPEPVNGT